MNKKEPKDFTKEELRQYTDWWEQRVEKIDLEYSDINDEKDDEE